MLGVVASVCTAVALLTCTEFNTIVRVLYIQLHLQLNNAIIGEIVDGVMICISNEETNHLLEHCFSQPLKHG